MLSLFSQRVPPPLHNALHPGPIPMAAEPGSSSKQQTISFAISGKNLFMITRGHGNPGMQPQPPRFHALLNDTTAAPDHHWTP